MGYRARRCPMCDKDASGYDTRLLRRGLGAVVARWHTTWFLAQDGEKRTQIFVLPASGGEAMQVTHSKIVVRQLAWRPDGQVLAFAAPDEVPEKKDEVKFEGQFRMEAVRELRRQSR